MQGKLTLNVKRKEKTTSIASKRRLNLSKNERNLATYLILPRAAILKDLLWHDRTAVNIQLADILTGGLNLVKHLTLAYLYFPDLASLVPGGP